MRLVAGAHPALASQPKGELVRGDTSTPDAQEARQGVGCTTLTPSHLPIPTIPPIPLERVGSRQQGAPAKAASPWVIFPPAKTPKKVQVVWQVRAFAAA